MDMINEFGNIKDVKTELYYEDKSSLPMLKMIVDYENGVIEIPKICLFEMDIIKKYSNEIYSYDYIMPKQIPSCNLNIPLGLVEGSYVRFRYKYPEVNKVYNINNNLIIGVDQTRNKDKTCLCFSKFKDGKFTVERFEFIEKQEDMDKYIEENKEKWI